MKTSLEMMKALRLRLYDMNSAGDVTLPATLVADIVDDAIEHHEMELALTAYGKAIDEMEKDPPAPTPIKKARHLRVVRNPPDGGNAA